MYRLPASLRSKTWTTISGRSEDESGDGFDNKIDIASGVTVFAILFYLLLSFSEICAGCWGFEFGRWKSIKGQFDFALSWLFLAPVLCVLSYFSFPLRPENAVFGGKTLFERCFCCFRSRIPPVLGSDQPIYLFYLFNLVIVLYLRVSHWLDGLRILGWSPM